MVRYLNPENHPLAIITRADKEFAKRIDFKDIKFSVKIKDIQRIFKKNIPLVVMLLTKKIKKNIMQEIPIMQEILNFNLKICVISNGLEKYVSFNINNKFSFIDGVSISQFLLRELSQKFKQRRF